MNKTNNKFKAALFAVAALLPASLFGAASITGTALNNAPGVAIGDYSVLLVDTSGSGFNTAALSSLGVGVDLSSSATYAGFEVLFTTTAVDVFGATVVEINANNFDVQSQPIVTGDQFGILTFAGGSTTSTGGTSYEIWTDAGWLIPANLGTPQFGTNYTALNSGSSPSGTGTVVPEPSAFGLLAGVFGLAWVMVRRRS